MKPISLLLAVALAPVAAHAALPGEIPLPSTIIVTSNAGLSAAALGGTARINVIAATPSLSLPSAPSPLPVVLPVSLPGLAAAIPARPVRMDPVAHELDWSFLGGSGPAFDAVPVAPTPRPLSPSAYARVQRAAEKALVSADAVFDGAAHRALAVVDW